MSPSEVEASLFAGYYEGVYEAQWSQALKAVEDYTARQRKLRGEIEHGKEVLQEFNGDVSRVEKAGGDAAGLKVLIAELEFNLKSWQSELANIPQRIRAELGAVQEAAEDAGKWQHRLDEAIEKERKRKQEIEGQNEALREQTRIRALILPEGKGTVAAVLGSVIDSHSRSTDAVAGPGDATGYMDIVSTAVKAVEGAAGQVVSAEEARIERNARRSSTLGFGAGITTDLSRSVLGGAAQGAAAGPFGAIGGAVLALVTSSKGFQKVMDAINPVLQMFSDALGAGLEVVAPMIRSLGETLKPLMGTFGVMNKLVLQMNPAFIVASAALRVLTDVIDTVADMIITTMLGVMKGIKKALGKMGISWKGLDKAIDAMKDLRDGASDAAKALAPLGDINVPPGYNIGLRRWGADEANAAPPPAAETPDMVPPGFVRRTCPVHGEYLFPISWIGSGDPHTICRILDEAENSDGQGTAASSNAMTAAEGAETSGSAGGSRGSRLPRGAQTFQNCTFVLEGVNDAEGLFRELERVGMRRNVVRSGNPYRGDSGR